jgi:hypothetical protein
LVSLRRSKIPIESKPNCIKRQVLLITDGKSSPEWLNVGGIEPLRPEIDMEIIGPQSQF